MALVYHYDCRPADASNDSYRTLRSKYEGTCNGCRQPYEKEAKIAYFGDGGNQSGGSRNSQPSGSNPAETAHLKQRIRTLEDQIGRFHTWCLIFESVDFHKLPKKNEQSIATTEEATMLFEGKQVDTTDEADAY